MKFALFFNKKQKSFYGALSYSAMFKKNKKFISQTFIILISSCSLSGIENDFVHSNGLNGSKDEKRGSLIKKSSSSQLNIVNINEKDDQHLNSIIRYQTIQPLHYSSTSNTIPNNGKFHFHHFYQLFIS